MVVCRAYYDKISSEKLAWDKNNLTNVIPVFGPSKRISAIIGSGCGNWKDKACKASQLSMSYGSCVRDAQGCRRN